MIQSGFQLVIVLFLPQEAASEMKTNVLLKCFWRGRQGEEAGQAEGAPSYDSGPRQTQITPGSLEGRRWDDPSAPTEGGARRQGFYAFTGINHWT